MGFDARASPHLAPMATTVILLGACDEPRPQKELVLGVRDGSGGEGYPFGELAELGEAGVVNDGVDGRPVAIFFEAGPNATGGTAVAFGFAWRHFQPDSETFEAAGP